MKWYSTLIQSNMQTRSYQSISGGVNLARYRSAIFEMYEVLEATQQYGTRLNAIYVQIKHHVKEKKLVSIKDIGEVI